MSKFRLILVTLLSVLVLLLAARPAIAQGTSGQLPDPIPTAELTRLLNLYVKPDPAQWATIETLHDDYRAQFRTLRESEIEAFLEEMQKLGGSGRMPSKAAVQEFLRKYERINGKIAQLDDSLFDAIGTLMGETRAPDVKRAKDARARARFAAGFMGQMPGSESPRVDVSAMVLQLRLPDAELATLQPELVAYEERMTSLSKEAAIAASRMMVEMFESLEKAGYGNVSEEEMMADPQKMETMMNATRDAMAKAMKPVLEKTGAMSETSSKLVRSVRDRLSPDAARHLRVRYINEAYGNEIGRDAIGVEPVFRAALRIKSLDEGVRTQTQEAYRAWQAADDAIVDEAVKVADENRKNFNPMGFGDMTDRYEAIGKLTTQRMELAQRTLESLKGIVGDERLTKLIERQLSQDEMFVATDDPETTEAVAEEPSIGVRASAREAAQMELASGGFERPVDVETVQGLIARSGVDAGIKAAVETIHGDYLKKWNDEVEPLRTKITEAQQGMWVWDQDSGQGSVVPEKRDAYFSARRDAVSRVLAMDDSLFHDIANVVGETKLDEIKITRLSRLVAGTSMSAFSALAMFGEVEQPVNVVSVLQEAGLAEEERASVMKALSPKIDEAEGTLRSVRSEQIDADRDTQLMQEESQRLYSSGETPNAADVQRMSQRWMEVQGRSAKIAERRAAAVNGMWSAAVEAVPEGTRERLQLAYDREAFPEIFEDPRSALPMLERALELHDLSESQRQELTVLVDRYRQEYLGYCRKMVPSRQPAPSQTDAQAMQAYWQKRMAEENDRAKVRFDRDERSQRAVSQLRRILSPEQAARIGGLAAYDQAASSKPGIPVD